MDDRGHRRSGAAARPSLLLVAPAGSYRIADHIVAAADLRCEVTVVTDAGVAIPGAAITADLSDPARAASLVLNAVEQPPDGVVGTDGPAVAMAAEIARRLGLPANAAAAVRTAGDKRRQRQALAAAGVPQPAFTVVPADAGAGLDDVAALLPAVVKPVDRSASQGVTLARTVDEVRTAVARVRRLVGPTAPVLVEEYVGGTEVAVDALLHSGRMRVLAMFDKPDTPTGPTFPETLLIAPARLPVETRDAVLDVVRRAVAAVGLTEGPVHAECIVDGDDVRFLELAARSIGGLCSRAIRPGGLRLEEVVIRHALDMPLPPPAAAAASGVLMMPVPTTGRLQGVDGVAEARAVTDVTGVALMVGPGDDVVALPDGDRYLGFVFAESDTSDRCERALRAAWARLDVRIDPATTSPQRFVGG